MQSTHTYSTATDSWKDRLTSYNGQTVTYDAGSNSFCIHFWLGTVGGSRYKVMRYQPGDWGIYTTNQADAKSLAVVSGCTTEPEVYGSGYYGHYYDAIHIWFDFQ